MKTLLSLLALGLPAAILYGQFLWNPIIFDDAYFFDGKVHHEYLGKVFSFDLRWLPLATFEWTHSLLGLDLIWFRLGNMALHLANIFTLFLFLRRLFEIVLSGIHKGTERMSPHWLAFFGALIFALHPVSVYAVAYLSQRTILMATLFTLLTWRLFLEGLIREKQRWLMSSAVTYLLAVLSKENAIMAPTVTIALLFLISNQLSRRFVLLWPTFLFYALIGAFMVFQSKSMYVLGQAYEPMASNLISRHLQVQTYKSMASDLISRHVQETSHEPMASDLISRHGSDFDVRFAYPLSILTQSFLFFKYLGMWIVPNPAWMSVDMHHVFAKRLWSWPEIAGLAGFIVYPITATRLLLQKGIAGLLGLALLCPWLLFATELSTIRIQESFVLYRSYLWMAGAFAALPFLCQRLSAKQATIVLTVTSLFMMPLSWNRLTTFSHPLLLWDDAARLVKKNQENLPGIERIFFNRGTELMRVKKYSEAIEDFNKTIKLASGTGYLVGYAYLNRGRAYLEMKQYSLALSDYNKVTELAPKNPISYLGKAQVFEAQNELTAAIQEYKHACLLGMPQACQEMEKSKLLQNNLSKKSYL